MFVAEYLRGGEKLKWKSRPDALAAALICIPNSISTLRGYSTSTTRTSTLFSFYHSKQKRSLSSLEERSTSICAVILIQKCWVSRSLLHSRNLRNADDWFSLKKYVLFFLYNVQTLGNRCECYRSSKMTIINGCLVSQ